MAQVLTAQAPEWDCEEHITTTCLDGKDRRLVVGFKVLEKGIRFIQYRDTLIGDIRESRLTGISREEVRSWIGETPEIMVQAVFDEQYEPILFNDIQLRFIVQEVIEAIATRPDLECYFRPTDFEDDL